MIPMLESLLAVLALSAAVVVAGGRFRGLLAREGQQRPWRWTLYGLAGMVLLYLDLLALDLAGIPWNPVPVMALLTVAAAGAHRLSRHHPAPAVARFRPGWGDGIALLVLILLAVMALESWSVHPDFIYHWGLKARRFAAVSGIDATFLARPWNAHEIHPAYPHLAPAIFAFTARVLGQFREGAMILWTVVVVAAMLAAARQVLVREGCSAFGVQATLAVTAVGLAMVGIGLQILGGPDWVIAALPLLAWPALTRPGPEGDRAVGLVAALGAGAKMEGIALGAFLVAACLWVRWRGEGTAPSPRRPWASLPRLALPGVLVALPWWWIGQQAGLFAHSYRGPFAPRWAGIIFRTMGERLALAPWHGLGWILLLLPLLVLARRTRIVGLVLTAQLAFYLYAYFASPYTTAGDVRFYVQSNFARLAFHLVPAILVGVGLLADRWSSPPARGPAPSGRREPALG